MSKYFDQFPVIGYTLTRNNKRMKVAITNIFVKLGISKNIKNNIYAYYDYSINEQDTPENLADRLYGDSEYHWIILMTNNIINPLFEWPMPYTIFNKYIISKYGSIANAQNRIDHYEKTISRKLMNIEDVDNEITFNIDKTEYDTLAESSYELVELNDGSTIEITTTKRSVDCYTWELESNERRRNIKLIKKEYLGAIQSEFAALMETIGNGASRSLTRRLIR